MRHRYYACQRILHLDLNCGISAESALERVMPTLKAHPELWNWDWIIDARVMPSDVSVAHIAQLVELFHRPDRAAITAIATQDRFMYLWARVMDFQFPNRRHLIVPSAAAAVRLIGNRRAAEDELNITARLREPSGLQAHST